MDPAVRQSTVKLPLAWNSDAFEEAFQEVLQSVYLSVYGDVAAVRGQRPMNTNIEQCGDSGERFDFRNPDDVEQRFRARCETMSCL